MCDQQSLRSACAYAQSGQSLCLSLDYSMVIKLLTEQRLEFLSLTGGCTGSSESALIKMPHCWKSHVTAHKFNTVVSLRTNEDVFGLKQHNALLCLVAKGTEHEIPTAHKN